MLNMAQVTRVFGHTMPICQERFSKGDISEEAYSSKQVPPTSRLLKLDDDYDDIPGQDDFFLLTSLRANPPTEKPIICVDMTSIH